MGSGRVGVCGVRTDTWQALIGPELVRTLGLTQKYQLWVSFHCIDRHNTTIYSLQIINLNRSFSIIIKLWCSKCILVLKNSICETLNSVQQNTFAWCLLTLQSAHNFKNGSQKYRRIFTACICCWSAVHAAAHKTVCLHTSVRCLSTCWNWNKALLKLKWSTCYM